MPTGYTEIINREPETTFEQFTWLCARNFGALVMLRDDSNAPVPEAFEPSPYETARLEKAQAEVARLNAMTLEQAGEEARREYEAEIQARAERDSRRRAQAARYGMMLIKVEAWNPPTPEHDGLKKFMVDQLTESIKFDCSPIDYNSPWYALPSPYGETWLLEKKAEAAKDLLRAKTNWQEEQERVAGRNAWIKALRDSLTPGKTLI